VKDILSPINYHHLKNTTVESLADCLKTDKQIFHKNLNSNINNGDYKLNFDKNDIKKENDKM